MQRKDRLASANPGLHAGAAVQHQAPPGEFAQVDIFCLDFETILEPTSYLRVTEAPS